jgi:hypothetical protein
MRDNGVRLPYQYRQSGGKFQVNGFIALALLAAAIMSAAYGYYQHAHRVIEINVTRPTATRIHVAPIAKNDAYVTHIFPDDQGEVCHFGDNICWIRI